MNDDTELQDLERRARQAYWADKHSRSAQVKTVINEALDFIAVWYDGTKHGYYLVSDETCRDLSRGEVLALLCIPVEVTA